MVILDKESYIKEARLYIVKLLMKEIRARIEELEIENNFNNVDGWDNMKESLSLFETRASVFFGNPFNFFWEHEEIDHTEGGKWVKVD